MQEPKKEKQNGFTKGLLAFFVVFIIGWLVFSILGKLFIDQERKPITEVLSQIQEGNVKRVEVLGDDLTIYPVEGDLPYFSLKETSQTFSELLSEQEIDPGKITEGITVKEALPWSDLFFNLAPILITVVVLMFLFRQAKGAGSQMFSFGKSGARFFIKGQRKPVMFSDIAGADEAKRELTEVVDFLKNPGKYEKLGARIPRGVLLVGPPGVGKTMLAKAIANEAGVSFLSMAGSEFMEMLVGVGASRVRDLFDNAKKSAPSLIFIDELESIGRQRGNSFVGGHDEREQTLNQILVEMDGFETGTNVIVLAATNRPDLLDPALMRPGRFDRRVMLELPDVSEREAILKIHMRGKPIKAGVNVADLAKRTVGFSGADIENMLNEAAILAAREEKTEIDEVDLEEAATKVKLGPERKRMQSDEEKKMVAYHEAGHAVVAYFLPEMDPVHRVSIVARGLSLGFTMFPPKNDRQNETKSRIIALISASLGGRAAEEIKFNEMTIGASSDLDQATGLARRMVFEFGMSSLGPMSIDGQEQMYNRQFGDSGISNELLAEADRETRKILNEAYVLSKKIIKEHKDKLDKVAEALIKKENINEDEFKELMA